MLYCKICSASGTILKMSNELNEPNYEIIYYWLFGGLNSYCLGTHTELGNSTAIVHNYLNCSLSVDNALLML